MNQSHVSGVRGDLRRTFVLALVLCLGFFVAASRAAIISPGSPTTTVPANVFDPLGSLTSPLPANQFLLPIEISGANVLQQFSFDLTFNAAVVTAVDAGGLFFHVYQTEFNAADPSLSEISDSGLLLPGLVEHIAGFFPSGVSGDGLLVFVLFQTLATGNPNFDIDNVELTQQAPEPGTLALLGVALAGLGWSRRRRQ